MALYVTNKAKYEKGRLVGSGTFSRVYLVRNVETSQRYAMAVFKEDLTPDLEERFNVGYSVMEHVYHKNLVSVRDRGSSEAGHPFTVMEYLQDMVPIDQYVRERDRPLDSENVVEIGVQICQALDALHREGIVHGDLHAGNILLDREQSVKLIDFGLARPETAQPAPESSAILVSPFYIAGALGYVAPELVSGPLRGDRRADIYALGSILYYLLTGRTPIGLYRRPSEIRHDIPQGWDRIIERCTAYSPEERYGSVEQVERELMILVEPISYDEARPTSTERIITKGESVKTPSKALKLVQLTERVAMIMGILSSIISLAFAVIAGIGTNLVAETIFGGVLPRIPTAYLTMIVVLISIAVGLAVVFFAAIKWYRRQSKQKELAIGELRERERGFFLSLENDISALLGEEAG